MPKPTKAPKTPKQSRSALRRKVGAKPPGGHVPTAQTRVLIQIAAAAGFSKERMAKLIGIRVETLDKYYAEEVENGADQMTIKVAAAMASIATSTTHKQAVPAQRFWLERRAGWTAPGAGVVVEHGGGLGADGEPYRLTIKIGDAKPHGE